MSIDAHDLRQLERAVALAHQAIGRSDPNPRVGCVLADAQGRVVGEGATQRLGEAHAEVVALQAALDAGSSLAGGTAWVSLEPCSHHGRTPPCCDALSAAGLRRVVVAGIDPNPLVAGAGLQRLRDAGVVVEMAADRSGVAQQARDLNIGFLSRMRRGRPWVRMKIAASLDGRTALPDGRGRWITGAAARHDGHAWRRRAGAVLTGSGTVMADNPRLDVRHVSTELQPLRAVVDSHLQVSAASKMFDAPGPSLVYSAHADAQATSALRARGTEVVALPGADGHVDLTAMLSDLAQRGINELHIEAGERLNGALLRAGLVDELLLYLAPTLLGPGRGMAELPLLPELPGAAAWRFESIERCSSDLRILARRADADAFMG